ncbi:MAG: FtsW/RodA/SpoVE family cell cycle protein [Streptosporangiales bacterium]|nr:FtsW/RodA/SpoVE family cell cycle protein [Streptosporangiales bacterium]
MSAVTDPVPAPRRRRGVELAMLVFAVLIAMAAYASVGLALDNVLPPRMLAYGLGLGALVTVAHIVVRRTAPYADPLLVPLITMLNGLGLVLIYRLDIAEAAAARQSGDPVPSPDATGQLLWTALGVAIFVGVLLLLRDHRTLQRYTYTAGAAGLVLLALPGLLPASISEVNGAKLWIRIGGFSIQPGEFAKLALMIFFAGYLVTKRDVLSLAGRRVLLIDLPRARDLGPVLVAWAVSLGILVFERDLGTSLLFFGIFVAMLYIATERTSWLLIGLGLFLSGAFLASRLFSHVQERLDIWLHPWAGDNPTNDAYQLVQGLYGLAQGGLLGTGLGQGRPEMVPFAKTDFIIATLGEELGLTGLVAVLLVYALVVERGLRAALAARDPFAKLLAAGLAFALALQVFIVVGGVTRLIPLTGLTTPFLSYGGSSLLANWALVALLLRVSDSVRRPAPQPIQDEGMTQVVSR